MSSSVSITVPSYNYTYDLHGVLSISRSFSLKVNTKADSESGTDLINGAMNQPDKLTLTVQESDVNLVAGWSARMMQALESIKRNRVLCDVVTPGFSYTSMLLSDLTVTEDEKSQSGWKGTLTFTQFVPPAEPEKTNDNASTTTNTGTAAGTKTISGSVFAQMLERAGIALAASALERL